MTEIETREAWAARIDAELGWRAIETAPMDGTKVSVKGDPYSNDCAVFEARYNRFPNGSAHWQTDDKCDLEPTHWMPLPSQPAKGS